MGSTTIFISPDADREEAFYQDMANQIDDLNPEQLIRMVKYEEKQLGLTLDKNREDLLSLSPVDLAYRIFFSDTELDPETKQPKYVDMKTKSNMYRQMLDKMGRYFNRAKILNILTSDEGNTDDLSVSFRLSRLTDHVCDSWQIVLSTNRVHDRRNNPTMVPLEVNTNPSLFRCSMPDFEELNVFQRTLLAILDHLYKNNIRRYKGYTCKQIKTKEGYNTRAWKQDEPIKDFVHRIAGKEEWFELWKDLTSANGTAMFSQIIKHLTDCNDMQFPEIKKNRRVWSFNNGIFIGSQWSDTTGLYHAVFYPFDSKEFMNLDPRIVSCKYFDSHFDDYSHIKKWEEIPTPIFDSVLEYQDYDREIIKWMCIFGGRLCFEVNEMDKWQVIPFLKGIARSGKSTLITRVFQKFYEADDVKTLSNNIEKKFGLSNIHDALIFIASEIKGDLQLEQAEFQSIVSGEEVSIAVKCEKAKNFRWKVPGILGGNEVPSWKDKSGSILRRLVTFHFGKQVRDNDTDPMLDTKLEKEIPIILQKCLRGYLDYAQKNQDKDIWSILPKYFFKIREQIAAATNPLEKYLQRDDLVTVHPSLKFPLDLFRDKLKKFCNDANIRMPNFDQDFYGGSFYVRGIEVKKEPNNFWLVTNPERLDKPVNYKDKYVIYGLTPIVEENEKGWDVSHQF
jgi:hypothetical protein